MQIERGSAVAAAFIQISGPDSDRHIAQNAPFSSHRQSRTTLSASGLLWSAKSQADQTTSCQVLLPAAALQPFLAGKAQAGGAPALVPDTRLNVRLGGIDGCLLASEDARVLSLVSLPAVARAAQVLLSSKTASGGSVAGFRWNLTPVAAPATTISLVAVLSCRLPAAGAVTESSISQQQLCQGAPLLAIGSPFGAAAPQHFANSCTTGIVSRVIRDGVGHPALLLADFRVLPGMEGGPVVDAAGQLAGMLTMPFCVRGHELPAVILATALQAALSGSTLNLPGVVRQNASSGCLLAPLPRRSMPCGGWDTNCRSASAPLAAVEAVPASSCHEHLSGCSREAGAAAILDGPPQQQRQHPLQQHLSSASGQAPSASSWQHGEPDRAPWPQPDSVSAASSAWEGTDSAAAAEQQSSPPLLSGAADGVLGVALGNSEWASGVLVNRQGTLLTNAHLLDSDPSGRRLRVVAHTAGVAHWHAAELVYRFKGALDIAVVQVLGLPPDQQPLSLSHNPARPGAPVWALGHVLFNPGGGQPPLLTSGNVARIIPLSVEFLLIAAEAVLSELSAHACDELTEDDFGRQQPAMLLTTAAVHVGASGGAMLDAAGCLLGLITSNTRHASGSTIPHLNFSIAANWLRPLWANLQQPQEAASLQAFDDTRPQLVHLWSLQPFSDDTEQCVVAPRSRL